MEVCADVIEHLGFGGEVAEEVLGEANAAVIHRRYADQEDVGPRPPGQAGGLRVEPRDGGAGRPRGASDLDRVRERVHAVNAVEGPGAGVDVVPCGSHAVEAYAEASAVAHASRRMARQSALPVLPTSRTGPTQLGHPLSQAQEATKSRAEAMRSSCRRNDLSARPTPPGARS